MTNNTAAPGSIGAGQQGPNDASSDANMISFAVRQIISEIDTMKPVRVVAVHVGTGTPPGPSTVDVLPLIQQIDGNRNVVSHGTVYGIPCSRVQGGAWTIVCDPAVGDFGYVVAADRDMSTVKSTVAEGPPGSLRKFSIADGVYVGAILAQPSSAYLWLKSDGSLKLVDKGGFVLETDGSGNATVTGGLNVTGDIKVTGNISATSDVTAASGSPATKVSMLGHIHAANNAPATPGH